jgi:hypothetical protein
MYIFGICPIRSAWFRCYKSFQNRPQCEEGTGEMKEACSGLLSAVIAAIRDQAFGSFAWASGLTWPADGGRVEGLLEARDFSRGSSL